MPEKYAVEVFRILGNEARLAVSAVVNGKPVGFTVVRTTLPVADPEYEAVLGKGIPGASPALLHHLGELAVDAYRQARPPVPSPGMLSIRR